MTASKPVARALASAGDLASAVVKYGEAAVAKVSGKEREQIESELRQAKAVGQFTVLMAVSKVKAAITPDEASVAPPAESTVVTESVPHGEAPACIDEYDSLTASQIVPLLADLTADERREVLAYESARRGRNSILKELQRLA